MSEEIKYQEMLRQKAQLEEDIQRLREEIEGYKLRLSQLSEDEWKKLSKSCETLLNLNRQRQSEDKKEKDDTTEEFQEIFRECMKEG